MEHSYSRRGFTLIELLVVLGIILVVTAVTITSQASFDKTLLLSNTAYDIALAIRTAEDFGLGSRVVGSTGNAGYGVHFDRGTNKVFTLFADTAGSGCHTPIGDPSGPGAIPGDCIYTAGSDTKINDYTLGNGMYVSNLCAFTWLGSWWCSTTNFNVIQQLDITFARPNADASFKANGSPFFNFTKACLVVTSPRGSARSVWVEPSGEISTNASQCPPPP